MSKTASQLPAASALTGNEKLWADQDTQTVAVTPAQLKTYANTGLTKASVGLGSVDNTSDANKPISTAAQQALDRKAAAADLTAHTARVDNPHAVTKTQVGLDKVNNTADADKPVSTAVRQALDAKADAAVVTVEDIRAVTVSGYYRTEAGANHNAPTASGAWQYQVMMRDAGNRAVFAWQETNHALYYICRMTNNSWSGWSKYNSWNNLQDRPVIPAVSAGASSWWFYNSMTQTPAVPQLALGPNNRVIWGTLATEFRSVLDGFYYYLGLPPQTINDLIYRNGNVNSIYFNLWINGTMFGIPLGVQENCWLINPDHSVFLDGQEVTFSELGVATAGGLLIRTDTASSYWQSIYYAWASQGNVENDWRVNIAVEIEDRYLSAYPVYDPQHYAIVGVNNLLVLDVEDSVYSLSSTRYHLLNHPVTVIGSGNTVRVPTMATDGLQTYGELKNYVHFGQCQYVGLPLTNGGAPSF